MIILYRDALPLSINHSSEHISPGIICPLRCLLSGLVVSRLLKTYHSIVFVILAVEITRCWFVERCSQVGTGTPPLSESVNGEVVLDWRKCIMLIWLVRYVPMNSNVSSRLCQVKCHKSMGVYCFCIHTLVHLSEHFRWTCWLLDLFYSFSGSWVVSSHWF